MGGTVLMHANAVLLAADCPLREGLRHELAHLFAFRWNLHAPPLVQEGLAVWLHCWNGSYRGVRPCAVTGGLETERPLQVVPRSS
jgi:hypothetical protein